MAVPLVRRNGLELGCALNGIEMSETQLLVMIEGRDELMKEYNTTEPSHTYRLSTCHIAS